jgi:DNA-binding LacI/PurR family transcriptional regulator
MMTLNKKKTIYTIAEELQLSPSTISKVINQTGHVNEKTRKRVLSYIKDVGYVPAMSARMLKSKRTYSLGVVFTEELKIGLEHAFFSSILQHFKTYVESQGYELSFIVRRLGTHEMSYLEWCMNKRVDGVFIVIGDYNDKGLAELVKSPIPCVSTDILLEGLHTVMSDNKQGVYLALEYVKNTLKTENVAYISGPLTSNSFKERYDVYNEFIQSNNWKQEHNSIVFAESYGFTSGYFAALKMMAVIKHRPEVIFVSSDDIALGVLKGLHDLKIKVPEEIQVIGFDDMPFSRHWSPSLTTIAQDRKALGEVAAQTLISLIEQQQVQNDFITRIPVNLIVRESTNMKEPI